MSAGRDTTIRVWDLRLNGPFTVYLCLNGPFTFEWTVYLAWQDVTFVVSFSGRDLVSAGRDKKIRVWEV